jgi:hypothetical protein
MFLQKQDIKLLNYTVSARRLYLEHKKEGANGGFCIAVILLVAFQSLHVHVRCHWFFITSYQTGRLLLLGPNFRVSRCSDALPVRECQP